MFSLNEGDFMKEKIKHNLTSNEGFTLQDLAVALIIIVLFAGVIGSMYISIYKLQAQTKLDAVLTSYAIRIMEYIDEISYEQVNSNTASLCKQQLQIPDKINVTIESQPYAPEENSQNIVKKITMTIGYTFQGTNHQVLMEKIKVKEK